MDFKARMAAAAARNKKHLAAIASELREELQLEAPALPAHVTYLGERNGKPHYRVMPVIERTRTAAQHVAMWAESKAEQHKAGGVCPHCQGTGRYFLHTKPGNNKCYRCHGKGTLDSRDIAFLNRRLRGKGPICWVVTAAAA